MTRWWEKAACIGQPLELFFPDGGWMTAEAKKLCGSCPVQSECLKDALAFETPTTRSGIWGGMSRWQRENVFDQRKRGSQRRPSLCGRGHELSADNIVIINGGTGQRCKICTEARRAEASSQETCRHGHEWTPENSAVDSKGYRTCRECRKERSRAWKVNNAT
jgi:WhiB family redox-sensing transcriptional regulator